MSTPGTIKLRVQTVLLNDPDFAISADVVNDSFIVAGGVPGQVMVRDDLQPDGWGFEDLDVASVPDPFIATRIYLRPPNATYGDFSLYETQIPNVTNPRPDSVVSLGWNARGEVPSANQQFMTWEHFYDDDSGIEQSEWYFTLAKTTGSTGVRVLAINHKIQGADDVMVGFVQMDSFTFLNRTTSNPFASVTSDETGGYITTFGTGFFTGPQSSRLYQQQGICMLFLDSAGNVNLNPQSDFVLLSAERIAQSIVGFTVGPLVNKPALVYDGTVNKWRYSNDGTTFIDFGVATLTPPGDNAQFLFNDDDVLAATTNLEYNQQYGYVTLTQGAHRLVLGNYSSSYVHVIVADHATGSMLGFQNLTYGSTGSGMYMANNGDMLWSAPENVIWEVGTGKNFEIQRGHLRLGDGVNLVAGTGTGVKIGTGTSQKLGFFNAAPVAQQDVTGSRGGNAALADLITKLAALGLITNSSDNTAAPLTVTTLSTGDIAASGYIEFGANKFIIDAQNRARLSADTGLSLGSDSALQIGWTDAGAGGVLDTALSRISAGVIGVGTGAAGSMAGAIVSGRVGILDGTTAPSAVAGRAQIYVDTADGDLKVIFGDGVVKTLAIDT